MRRSPQFDPHACQYIQAQGIVACQGCPFDYRKTKSAPDICGDRSRAIKRAIRKGKYPEKGIPIKVKKYLEARPPEPAITSLRLPFT